MPCLLGNGAKLAFMLAAALATSTASAEIMTRQLTQLSAQQYQAMYGNLPAAELLRLSGTRDAYATLEIGNRLATGSGGFPQNHSEAARLYSLAAQVSFPHSIDGLGMYPLPPYKTDNPDDRPALPPTTALPTPLLISTVSSGDAPLNTLVSIDPEWDANALVYSWDVNQDAMAQDTPALNLTFDEPGEQSIVLRVMDDTGRTTTASTTIDVLERASVTEPPELPIPIFPAQDALVGDGTTVDFQWEAAQFVDTYDFHFFDGVTPRTLPFLTNLPAADLCDDTVCTLSLPIELPLGGSHAWRIRARNSFGLTGWTRNRFDVVQAITEAPTAPLLLGPDNAAIIENGSTVSFGWLPAERAESYALSLTNASNDSVFEQTLSAAACSSSACTLSTTLNLTELERYQWTVQATNTIGSTDSEERTLSIIPLPTQAPMLPENIVPVPNALLAEGSTVTFQWSHDPQTATYEFHFFNRTDGEEIFTYGIDPQIVCANDVCSIDQVVNLPVDINHAWRVRARNSLGITTWTRSQFDVVLPVNEPPGTPVAITPLANSFIETGNPISFTWEKEPLALSYAFEITQGGAVSTSVSVSQSACGENTCSVNLPLSLAAGANENHLWRVQALNSNGPSDWLETAFVLIETPDAVPAALSLLSPTSADILVQRASVAVLWSKALGATSYDVLIEDRVNGEVEKTEGLSPLDVCVADVCTHTVVLNVSPGTNQSIRVRSANSLGRSEWSIVDFQVIDDGAPDAPTIISPLDNTFFADLSRLPVSWQEVPFATAYELELVDHNVIVNLPKSVCVATTATMAAACGHVLDLPLTSADTDAFDLRVRATTPSGTSDWATTSFTVITDNNDVAPVASFSLANFTGNALGAAPFSLSADPRASTDDVGIVSYDWMFSDDGLTVRAFNDSIITHMFTEPGVHTITLTVTDAQGLTNQASREVTIFDPANTLSDSEASRLLTQATFGPTDQSILELRALGVDTWLAQQFSLQGPDHLDYVNTHSNGSQRWPRHEVWWQDVVEGDDQLRQRVAFALSELFVISDIGYTLSNSQYGVTHFYDQLRHNAFGNYRQLLETVTKSPVMGLYLSMLQNEKADEAASTRPDENYAREVLQLFSIGVDELNLDGTPTGEPAYTLAHVEEFARVFTGWNYKDAGSWDRGLNTGQDLISPMEPFEQFHDTGSKVLLNNEVVPAGLSAEEDLDRALDNIANHPNVGPFIAKHLIQRLITSNPSPAFVARVATAFNDNGNGERGDLGFVVESILMDAEARTLLRPPHFGKLREPVLRLSHLWRAFSVSPGTGNTDRGEYNTASPQLADLELATGQAVLKSPSVFNFFKPEFAAIGPVSANNLVAPEFEVMTETTEIATTNRIGDQINRFFDGSFDALGTRVSYLNFDTELALADDSEALVDHLDILLMSGLMPERLRTQLSEHIDALPDTPLGHSARVRDAVTLMMASPDYLIQQ